MLVKYSKFFIIKEVFCVCKKKCLFKYDRKKRKQSYQKMP